MSNPKDIVLLKGGISSEREVSLRTGAGVAKALRGAGYNVTEIDVQSKDFALPAGTKTVFICLHGTFGEDGELQDRLEREGVAYTGSGPVGCRNAFDKMLAKKLFTSAGVSTPRADLWPSHNVWHPPYVLKPVSDGSSVGVSRVTAPDQVAAAEAASKKLGSEMMIEEMILGREFTVGVLGDRALPVIEIRVDSGFYDYQHKYTAGKTEYLCPAPVDAAATALMQKLALEAHRSLACDVYSRVDLMMDGSGAVHVLEVNTIPGMTELSLLPKAAAAAAISYAQLCETILELSLQKRGILK